LETKRTNTLIWLALDVATREIVGVYLGERGESGARGLWNSLPATYRQGTVCYTDFWESYGKVFPHKRHRPVEKKTGLTNLIEKFNNTLRQIVSRLVRQTLFFSKKLENHLGSNLELCSSLKCFFDCLVLPSLLLQDYPAIFFSNCLLLLYVYHPF